MSTTESKSSQVPMISIRGVCKSFALNNVLKGINLNVNSGDVVAIIGGNGAGKSTLMKIIMGIYQQDAGEIFINGEKANLNSPSAALAKGIYLVPQEPMLFPNMTVEENIVLGFDEKRSDLHTRLVELNRKLGWDLKLDQKADSLSIAEQQLVEIMRGLLRNSQILILDEPTSALTFNEIESLFKIVEDLKKSGICIFYITHRLTEVFQIATRVVILRDGIITIEGSVKEFTQDDLIKGLLPPNAQDITSQACTIGAGVDYTKTKPMLEVQDFCGYGFDHINMNVYPGEILGIAGVVGAGRTELAVGIFGIDEIKSGKVLLDGEDITGKKTRQIIDKGLNYVPEDRHLNAIYGIRGVTENVSSGVLRKMSKVFINSKAEKELADQYIKDFRIKVTGRDQLIGSLSGGNQQKVVIAKTLATKPKVVILDEPTRGIDAGARGDVYKIINQLKEQGVAVVLISSDIEEVVQLSDRVMTMFQGSINHTFERCDITVDNLMAASFGVYEKGVKAE
ncbi:monosaccharide ABC transporter ATP-binding protein (CUT2 family) [Hydrogenoanaerobacterium saccharovorans]|uniref:Autoinducer 2 import ATP-binding protein LsrA n=1 Tax=Hydrogenoanaerobacterium saccharovorans TaxID=474960 RepID=A0A1H8BDC8_9FIRM|nr:sugar ABC transporter ATP-binding protein [Hydrogenoanaerobacterium saccharovorans]RPF47464.1 monosaccharide ABC transporter ATP-binding protein (CUT2 family) [Hydrogenoanaerobacterium saccharovorans]SEM80940.1 monosaccharide ABC transporter ATP-binding protein, CUT2 family [Hydrogenoanaerobacterium saccharovorans]